jgi:CTP:molybdopterin cytidylyltransferase MocA
VPAAGAASRFGGGKLLAPVGGVPMLDRTISALLGAGIDDVVVVVAPDASFHSVIRSLDDPRVRTRVNPDPSRGMFSSIQIGLTAIDRGPIAVLPADMPFVRTDTVAAVLEAALRTGAIVSPRLDGRRGHPVMLPIDVRAIVLAAPAHARLNDVLRPLAERFVNIDVEDRGVVRDVDVVGDLVS